MPRGIVVPEGRHIAALRGEAGLTQVELAERAGFGLRTISKIEAGRPTSAATLDAVTTVLARQLRRDLPRDELLVRSRPGRAPAADLIVAEHLKVLDLRGWPAAGGLLHDHLRLRRPVPRACPLICHYATTGTGVEGRCLSHTGCWTEVTDFGTAAGHPRHLDRCYEMRVRLEPATGAEVVNEVRYLDGFRDRPQEWFHTHVSLPTDRLTLIVQFPPVRPFSSIHGIAREHPAGPFQATSGQPAGLPAGELAYWSIEAPRPGALYQIEWAW